jgi:hypothetical protein
MKDISIHSKSYTIVQIADVGQITLISDNFHIATITEGEASKITPTSKFYDGEVKSFEEMMEIESKIRDEVLYTENPEIFRARKRREIVNARNAEYTSVLVTSDGLHFKTDLETIIDVKTIIETLSSDTDVYQSYKNADGSYNDITKAQFQTSISEGIMRKGAAFLKQKTLVDAINAAQTKEELDLIVW